MQSSRRISIAPKFSPLVPPQAVECDFPHVLLQNGEWPVFDFDDAERVATLGHNRKTLATLLRDTGEATVELYGL